MSSKHENHAEKFKHPAIKSTTEKNQTFILN